MSQKSQSTQNIEGPLSAEQGVFLQNANLYWQNHGYEAVLTGDGSPTLRTLKSQSLETMHHRGGAYSETQLIYGETLRRSLADSKASVLSVGLGLGYNEILFAVEALAQEIAPENAAIESFEIDDILVSSFYDFIEKGADPSGIYTKICDFFIQDRRRLVGEELNKGLPPLEISQIRLWLQKAFESGSLRIRTALSPQVRFSRKFHVIFYDAFSSKTDPDLWSEEFLFNFWSEVAEANCLVSTYACTGALKRSLKKAGFALEIKEGFQSKRDRTLGVRV